MVPADVTVLVVVVVDSTASCARSVCAVINAKPRRPALPILRIVFFMKAIYGRAWQHAMGCNPTALRTWIRLNLHGKNTPWHPCRSRPTLEAMKSFMMIRSPAKHPLLGSRVYVVATLVLALCGLAFATNVAGGFVDVGLVAVLVMYLFCFFKMQMGRPPQLQPALSFYRLNSTASQERNATSFRSVKNRMRRVI